MDSEYYKYLSLNNIIYYVFIIKKPNKYKLYENIEIEIYLQYFSVSL